MFGVPALAAARYVMNLAIKEICNTIKRRIVAPIANVVNRAATDDAEEGTTDSATTDAARGGANWERGDHMKK